jgi:hypothetical protein
MNEPKGKKYYSQLLSSAVLLDTFCHFCLTSMALLARQACPTFQQIAQKLFWGKGYFFGRSFFVSLALFHEFFRNF